MLVSNLVYRDLTTAASYYNDGKRGLTKLPNNDIPRLVSWLSGLIGLYPCSCPRDMHGPLGAKAANPCSSIPSICCFEMHVPWFLDEVVYILQGLLSNAMWCYKKRKVFGSEMSLSSVNLMCYV